MPNMIKTQTIMIITLRIPHIDCANDEMIIFIYKFLETILKGLKVLNNLRILRSMSVNIMSIMAVVTIRKSNFDQLSLMYEFYPKMNPLAITLRAN